MCIGGDRVGVPVRVGCPACGETMVPRLETIGSWSRTDKRGRVVPRPSMAMTLFCPRSAECRGSEVVLTMRLVPVVDEVEVPV